MEMPKPRRSGHLLGPTTRILTVARPRWGSSRKSLPEAGRAGGVISRSGTLAYEWWHPGKAAWLPAPWWHGADPVVLTDLSNCSGCSGGSRTDFVTSWARWRIQEELRPNTLRRATPSRHRLHRRRNTPEASAWATPGHRPAWHGSVASKVKAWNRPAPTSPPPRQIGASRNDFPSGGVTERASRPLTWPIFSPSFSPSTGLRDGRKQIPLLLVCLREIRSRQPVATHSRERWRSRGREGGAGGDVRCVGREVCHETPGVRGALDCGGHAFRPRRGGRSPAAVESMAVQVSQLPARRLRRPPPP